MNNDDTLLLNQNYLSNNDGNRISPRLHQMNMSSSDSSSLSPRDNDESARSHANSSTTSATKSQNDFMNSMTFARNNNCYWNSN